MKISAIGYLIRFLIVRYFAFSFLAGADVVQVVSTIYKHGPKQLTKNLEEVQAWMETKGYTSLEDFKGSLSNKNTKDLFTYQCALYMEILMKSDEIFENSPMC